MKLISTILQEEADIIKEEIFKDQNEWFWPVDKKHEIFEQARMKFINRNLNYFNFPSMVAQTIEGNDFNPNLPKTLEFCDGVTRELTNETGPFGRMCVWKMSPGKQILPHKDAYQYHFCIRRNIFVISDNKEDKLKININSEPVLFDKGTLFQFSPATELHEFINNSDDDFYFLGFDFWMPAQLVFEQERLNFNKVINDPNRLAGFGGPNTLYKFISKH